jgi:ferredoxin
MQAQVKDELCIGCGVCTDVCPEVFIIEGNTAKVKLNPVPAHSEERCKKVKEDCPVEAIDIEG